MSKSLFRTLAQLVTEFETLGVIDCEDVVEYQFYNNDGSCYHYISIRRDGFEHTYEVELLERVFRQEFPYIIFNKEVKDKHHFVIHARIYESKCTRTELL